MRESRYNIWIEDLEAEYVFNCKSGALLQVPVGTRFSVQEYIAAEVQNNCSVALLEKLALGRMLVSNDTDEIQSLLARYKQSQSDLTHLGLTIVTSLACNFDCVYCFEQKKPSIMTSAVQDGVVELLRLKLPSLNSLSVTWFGGEPLLGRRALLKLSDRFIDLCETNNVNYQAGIVTNGYLLDAKTCKQLHDRRVSFAQVSLDGSSEVHNRMRPLSSGRPSFDRIVANLHNAIQYFSVSIRMNMDINNAPYAEDLLKRLADEGFSDKLTVYAGQIVASDEESVAPSTKCRAKCFTNAQFSNQALNFRALAAQFGFAKPYLPTPNGAPCTAVRQNEWVVGSEGELYKCWESVGNPGEAIGSVFDKSESLFRDSRWFSYDPFADSECLSCIAFPVCMGGCAHHGMNVLQRENRCHEFRHTYQEQVRAFVCSTSSDNILARV